MLVKAQDLFVCVVDDCVLNHFEFAVFVVFSLEEAYEALKTLEILGVDRKSDLKSATCENVVEVLASPSSTLKDAFYALSVNGIMRCKSGKDVPKVNNCLSPFKRLE